MERQYCHDERQGYGDERYYRCPHIHEEKEQHDDDEESTLVERLLHIVYRTVDESLLSVYICCHLHVRRESRRHVLESLVYLLCQSQRARLGLFRHGYHDTRLASQRRHARLRSLVAYLHLGYIPECQRHCA